MFTISEKTANMCKICNQVFKSRHSKMYHVKKIHKLSPEEYVIKIYYNNVIPICKCGCETPLKFRKNKLGPFFLEYVNGHNTYVQKDEIKKKREATKLKKYGNKYYNNPKQNKISKKKNYGNENYNNQKKRKQTLLARYGNENYTNQEKKKKTSLEKYGTEHPWSSPEVRKKTKISSLKKYGTEYPIQNEKIRKQTRDTHLKNGYYTLLEKIKESVTPLFSLDEYTGIGYYDRYQFQCQKCKNKFEDYIYAHIPRCKKCFPPLTNTSLQEKEIIKFLKSFNIPIKLKDRVILNGHEIDIILPSITSAIEYNGLYWHGELNGKDKKYHLNKTIECEKQGIHLIHIFEDEWLYKKEIVKRKLIHLLGLSANKVYARNCNIKEISSQLKNEFLDKYHIQGQDKSAVKLGLFHNNELIGVMTFGKERISLGGTPQKNCFELIRYATSTSIIGGASKLLQHFIRTYNPKKIITYADRRWTFHTNNLYEKIGFDKIGETQPNYWYVFRDRRFHRFGFRKSILENKLDNFNSSLTEWENMQLNGYDRIWDCGHFKYFFNRT